MSDRTSTLTVALPVPSTPLRFVGGTAAYGASGAEPGRPVPIRGEAMRGGRPMTAVTCPVCQGKGSVPRGFYLSAPDGTGAVSGTVPVTCRSCNGLGYLIVPIGD
jgi:hypothetical protein